jgi:hypothetical protein
VPIRQASISEAIQLHVFNQVHQFLVGLGWHAVERRLVRLTTATAIPSPAATVAMVGFLRRG